MRIDSRDAAWDAYDSLGRLRRLDGRPPKHASLGAIFDDDAAMSPDNIADDLSTVFTKAAGEERPQPAASLIAARGSHRNVRVLNVQLRPKLRLGGRRIAEGGERRCYDSNLWLVAHSSRVDLLACIRAACNA